MEGSLFAPISIKTDFTCSVDNQQSPRQFNCLGFSNVFVQNILIDLGRSQLFEMAMELEKEREEKERLASEIDKLNAIIKVRLNLKLDFKNQENILLN